MCHSAIQSHLKIEWNKNKFSQKFLDDFLTQSFPELFVTTYFCEIWQNSRNLQILTPVKLILWRYNQKLEILKLKEDKLNINWDTYL